MCWRRSSREQRAVNEGRNDRGEPTLGEAGRGARPQGSEAKQEPEGVLLQKSSRGEGREIRLQGAHGMEVDRAPHRARVGAAEKEVMASLG